MWKTASPLNIARSGIRWTLILLLVLTIMLLIIMLRAVVLGDRIYVLGGWDGEERLNSVECFTPLVGISGRAMSIRHQVQ